ncbi:MAG: Ig domain-containing protein [Planctomycetota bacterium]
MASQNLTHRGLAVSLTTLLAFILSAVSVAQAQASVLIAGGDSNAASRDDVKNFLDATGILGQVDHIDISSVTPTVADLQAYDCVLIYTNNAPLDGVAFGNNLAAYCDAGGGVVEMQASDTVTWGVHGTWDNRHCIQPLNSYSFDNAATAGTVHENHVVLQGANVLNGGYLRRFETNVINGARKIQDWSDGNICVAINESFTGRIVLVNLIPWTSPYGGWNVANNDIDILIANACAWAGNPEVVIDTPAAGALPDAYVGTGYSQTIVASGGATPYVWSTTNGSLPTGMSIDPNSGEISGNPTTPGSYSFDVVVTDDNSVQDTRSYSIEVYAALQITSPSAGALPNGLINNAYGPINFSASGGKPTLTWSLTSGTLPTGITQNTSTGALSGTPTSTGTSNFTVRVTDSNGAFHERSYSIQVFDTPVITSPAGGALTPEGYVGSPYSLTFTAAGGVPAYTWSVQAGSLPAGLVLNTSTGALTGAPTTAGANSFTIRVTDTNNDFNQVAYTLQILDPPSITSPTPGALPQATRNAPNYTQTFTGANGKAPLAWSATGLPAGMTLNASTGVLSGTPGAAGAFNVNVTLTDANGKTGNGAYTLQVAAAVALTGSSLADGEEEQAYSQTPGNSGGTGPYTWSMLITPALADLSMDPSTGLITGTPAAGTSNNYTVAVTLTDSLGGTANKNYTLYITQPGGGTAANCGCNSSATTRDSAFAGWLMLLLPMLLLVARRRLA